MVGSPQYELSRQDSQAERPKTIRPMVSVSEADDATEPVPSGKELPNVESVQVGRALDLLPEKGEEEGHADDEGGQGDDEAADDQRSGNSEPEAPAAAAAAAATDGPPADADSDEPTAEEAQERALNAKFQTLGGMAKQREERNKGGGGREEEHEQE